MNTYVILHNIRSAHNVGSIFRTSDGAGVSKIYLTGYTPSPVDRFGRMRPEIAKTSLGASTMVPYESVEDIHTLITMLKKSGITVVAVEQTKDALDYKTYRRDGDTAYIFGNEVAGIEEAVLNECSAHILIPLKGEKESLNVSVTAGVILFQVCP